MIRRNGDLDRTNDRAAKRRKRLHDYRQRTTRRREKRRLLSLLELGIVKGWVA